MFKWLAKQFRQADDDPDSLGSQRGLEIFIASVPVTVPARTVEALGEPFESAASLGLEPPALRRALKRIDERAQEALPAVWESLFDDTHARVLSDGAWLCLARFYRNLHNGYRYALDSFAPREEQADEERSGAVIMACRAMAALGRQKALLRMRYRAVDEPYWEHLHGLAAWSAAFTSSKTLVELYPDSGYQSSVEREYLIALAFDAAPIANLLPAQMAALDLLVRRLATHFHFADSYRESAPFAIEPGHDSAVRRSLKGLSPRPGQRFFSVSGAYAQLGILRKQAQRELPEWIAPSHVEMADYRSLLDMLLTHWSAQPPQRRHRRDRIEGELLVTHGVGQVRRMIAASEYAQSGGKLGYDNAGAYEYKIFGQTRAAAAATGDREKPSPVSAMETLQKFELEGDRQMTERWQATDRSESGLGAVTSAHGGWARTGMLIGYRAMDSLEWQICVIRRLTRSVQGKLSIGAQAIAARSVCARLRFGSGDAGNPWVAVAGSSDAYHDAILLQGEESARLLLEPGIFTEARECMLSFAGVWHRAQLERLLDSGYDFELVEIRFFADTASSSPP